MTSKPQIGLNAQLLSLAQNYRSAGISWYIYNLLTHLSAMQPAWRYRVFVGDKTFQGQSPLTLQQTNWPTHNPLVRIAWEQACLPYYLKREKINLLHALAFVAPLGVPCPFVTTVYDLSFMRYPNAFKPFNRFYLSTFTRYSSKRAKAIMTISESTRQDVIHFFGISPAKVKTIYCGVDPSFKPLSQATIADFKAKQGLPEKFIFRLGTIEPRKNVEGLIKAYAIWQTREAQAPPLFIAGGKGWYYKQVFQLVEALGLTDKIIFPGYLPQEDLVFWYNAASLFVYPSYFEGFGLPVLEAMACGTPVITSNVSSLPEVAGDAARLIDPDDIEQLSEAMQEIFYQPALIQHLIEQGLQQAACFSWDKTAQETVAVYKRVLDKLEG